MWLLPASNMQAGLQYKQLNVQLDVTVIGLLIPSGNYASGNLQAGEIMKNYGGGKAIYKFCLSPSM